MIAVHTTMVTYINDLGQYDYDLPTELIAHRPSENREEARLLVFGMKSKKIIHAKVGDLAQFLPEKSLLVCNNTKVFAARVKAQKITGGEAEIFFLKPEPIVGEFEVLIKARGKKKIDDEFLVQEEKFKITQILHEGFKIQFVNPSIKLDDLNPGVPIPPYIRDGESDEQDKLDYQTSFAKHTGSIAAPTAGLHFSPDLLNKLEEKEIPRAEVTLHVGLGTFSPIRVNDFTEHEMHKEEFFIDENNLNLIQDQTKSLIAIGTTSLRVLESSFKERQEGKFQADKTYETDIFIYPGKEVNSIKGLMTNFHLPKSSLFLLLCAYIGTDQAKALYQEAIDLKYRFFSYGDAMLCLEDL